MIRSRRTSFNAVETALVVAGALAIGYLSGRYQAQVQLRPFLRSAVGGDELRPLEERFGSSQYSEHGEEWILRDFFNDARGGVFVDVGANDYKRFSNTYYLETVLGWSGLAIEPQTKFAAGYAAHRPNTAFVPMFVADVVGQDVVINVPENDLLASSDKAFAEGLDGPTRELQAKTTTLDEVLTAQRVERIDFMSIDIELAEPAALKGFTIARFKPRLVCIEAHQEVRQEILDYFQRANYSLIGRYLRADNANLWFTPN